MIKRHTLFILSFIVLPVFINAQDGNSNISKDEIISKVWNSMFGDLKNDELKSIYVEVVFPDRDIPSRMTLKRPNFFRNETRNGVLVFDSECAAWAKREPEKEGNPRYPEMIAPAHWRHFEVDIAMLFPAFFDYPSQLIEIENQTGTEAYEINVELPLGGNVTYFVDCKSFLITRRLISWEGKPEEGLWENLITGYTDYNGILFPDGYTYEGDEGRVKMSYKNVKFNIKPGDDLFEIPNELK